MSYILKNASIVNEGSIFQGSIRINNDLIAEISEQNIIPKGGETVIDLTGKHIIPGLIDDQVHFREPGLTHKAEIFTESRAAVAGGITSFMEMPNTVPNVLTQELLEDKYKIAAKRSLANYSFYMGASNDNIEEVLKTDPKTVCGVKVFMGSSTGNMLVDNETALRALFSQCKMLIASHCEDEDTIRANSSAYKEKYGNCQVSKGYDQNPSLGNWVNANRVQYKRMICRKESQITLERIKKLQEIGFIFDLQEEAWNTKYKLLMQYCKEHNDCLVRQTDEENKENAANKVKITNDAGQVRLTAKMRAKEKELRRFAGVQRNRPLRQSEK